MSSYGVHHEERRRLLLICSYVVAVAETTLRYNHQKIYLATFETVSIASSLVEDV